MGIDPLITFEVDLAAPAAIDAFEANVGLFAAEHLAREVAIHAALIRAGSIVVMVPGSSMTGKTTLCVAAVDAGLEVLSDEFVLVDPASGLVRGWPRPMRVRAGSGWVRQEAVAAHLPVTVSLIAFVSYEPGLSGEAGSPIAVEPMTPGEVAMDLLAQTVCAQSRPHDSLQATLALARSTNGVRGARAQAPSALAALLEQAARTQL